MSGFLARLLVVSAVLVIASETLAHDSWISRGALRNAAGEWCCGEGDCFVIPRNRIMVTAEGYAILGDQASGTSIPVLEIVPYSQAQPSPDGEFWRCKRPDGSRRCFFAPPPTD
jgi:hypothetical protein